MTATRPRPLTINLVLPPDGGDPQIIRFNAYVGQGTFQLYAESEDACAMLGAELARLLHKFAGERA
jgi:hypothetical protein